MGRPGKKLLLLGLFNHPCINELTKGPIEAYQECLISYLVMKEKKSCPGTSESKNGPMFFFMTQNRKCPAAATYCQLTSISYN